MTTNIWTIHEHGSERNARAEALAAEEQRAARFRALDAAGPCPLCGWSGTVATYDYRCKNCGAEGIPAPDYGLDWAACINCHARWILEPKEEPCPNGCEPR